METLKYTIIKDETQYYEYCQTLELLIAREDEAFYDEIELLIILIEKWDNDHNAFDALNPVDLLKALMLENQLKANDLISILGLSKGTISKILNYRKGLSKETIRRLADFFKVSQEAFNRPYEIKNNLVDEDGKLK